MPAQSPDDPDAAISQAVAGVVGSGFGGSAVLVYDPAYGEFIATCAHVLNSALGLPMHHPDEPDVSRLRFEFQDGATGPVRVVERVELFAWVPRGAVLQGGLSWDGDLALLRIVGDRPPGVAPVPLAEHRVGAEAWSWFGSGAPATLVSARVDSYAKPWLTLNTTVSSLDFDHGYSGGGLWDRWRQAVVGVVVGKMDGVGTGSGKGRGYAIPAATVRALIRGTVGTAEGEYALWREVAQEHFENWAALDDPGLAEVQDAVLGLVGRLAAYCSTAALESPGDPWRAPRLAVRMSEMLGILLRQAKARSGDVPKLSAAEKVLLVLAPFLHAAGWEAVLRAADTAGRPEDLERFRARFPVLVEKQQSAAARRNPRVASTVDHWLRRQWAVSSAGRNEAVAALLEPASTPVKIAARKVLQTALDPATVGDLFATLVAPPSPIPSPDRAQQLTPLRFDLVAKLATVGQLMAVDPMQVAGVCDQLTVRGGYDVAELRDCAPAWVPLSLGDDGPSAAYNLDLQCRQVETEALLRAHCIVLDDFVLQVVHDSDALRQLLPVRFASLRLRAATEADGRPKYVFSDTRFTLDDDLMRDLLMGEKLYGDPALAYRELFQNALDACRYRDKQLEYLEKAKGDTAARKGWYGLIEFRAGRESEEEGGREWVECRDTGVGMGRYEVQNLFARGGARFVHSLEYLRERALWAEQGVEFHPNSRFGIGVFSYFMIADEIRVRTYRRRAEGGSEYLQVDVAGPAAPLRIERLPDDEAPVLGGTTVRLYLKPGLRWVARFTQTLRRLVWYCDYKVDARYGEDVFELEPGELSKHALPALNGGPRLPGVMIDSGVEPGVWWCSQDGAVLSDGILIEHEVFGAVVNLTGRYSPMLTVDRLRPQDGDVVDRHLAEILSRNVESLVDGRGTVLTPQWLTEFPPQWADLADRILIAAAEAGVRPWLGGDVARVGCLPQEANVGQGEASAIVALLDYWRSLPPALAAWRIRAWSEVRGFPRFRWGGEEPASVLALPSDGVMIRGYRRDNELVVISLGHVLRASLDLRRKPGQLADRLRALGVVPPDISRICDADGELKVDGTTLLLLSAAADGDAQWISDDARIDAARVVTVAHRCELSLEEVAERYRALGFTMAEGIQQAIALAGVWGEALRKVHAAEGRIAQGRGPRASVLHEAAEELDIDPGQLWDVFKALGYPVPVPEGWSKPGDAAAANQIAEYCAHCEAWIVSDLIPFRHSQHLAGQDVGWMRDLPTWLSAPGTEPLTPRMVGGDSFPLDSDTLAQLESHGYDVAALRSLPLIDQLVLGAIEPMRDSDAELRPAHVVIAALLYAKPISEAQHLLRGLGFCVPEFGLFGNDVWWAAPEVEADDMALLTEGRDGRFLDPADPVEREQVVAAAAASRRPVSYVIERLKAFGYEVEDLGGDPDQVRPDDVRLFSRNGDGLKPWLPREPVSLAQLLFLAAKTGRAVTDVASRLRFYGYELPSEVDYSEDL